MELVVRVGVGELQIIHVERAEPPLEVLALLEALMSLNDQLFVGVTHWSFPQFIQDCEPIGRWWYGFSAGSAGFGVKLIFCIANRRIMYA
ncbi:hypothetical protein D3C75_1032920 [compost metagenome]